MNRATPCCSFTRRLIVVVADMVRWTATYFLVAGLVMQHIRASAASSSSCGQNCQFTCHCAGITTCSADATCQSCADNWAGHKCQIVDNIARGKSVTLSSTLAFWNRPGSLAVDGDSRRDFYGAASCVSTGIEQAPWLHIDLGDKYAVQELTISTLAQDIFTVLDNHTDTLYQGVDLFPDIADGSNAVDHTTCLLRCLSKTSAECKKVASCKKAYSHNGCWRVPDHETPQASSTCSFNERLSSTLENLKVHVDGGLCRSTATTIAGDREEIVSCDQTVVGRIVTLSLQNTDARPLALCEVKVKGYQFVECRRGYHGVTCDSRCSSCSSGGGCNKFTGTCCGQYKTGAQCDNDFPYLKKKPWRTRHDSSSITIEWDAWKSGNGVGPVNKYCLRVNKQRDTTAPSCVDVNAPSTSHTAVDHRVGDLTHSTVYVFSVACYLTDGLGDVLGKPTEQITVKTSCRAPKPVNLPNKDVTSSAMPNNGAKVNVIVKWSMVTGTVCDTVEYYRVTAHFGNTLIKSSQVPGTQDTVTLGDLNPYTDYVIRVEARNNEGLTAVSNEVTHKTAQGFSGPVQGITIQALGPYRLNVTWSAPSDPRGQINGYRIRHRQVGIGDCDHTVHSWSGWLTVTTMYHTIHEVQPYRQYEVMVAPKNGFGAGSPTNNKKYTTESVPMSYIRNVNMTTIEKRSAEVIWDAPSCEEKNGRITSYKYHIRGISLDLTKNTDDNSPSTELTGLAPYATYSFKVTAVNGAGPGPNYSQQVVFTTEGDVPPPPENITFPGTGPTSIIVMWLAPYPPHGDIENYDVKITDQQTGNHTYHQTNNTKYNLIDLETNVTYGVKVRAKTEVGWGNWSTERYAFTKEGVPSQPTEVTVISITKTGVTLTWKEPKFPNGEIKGYQIKCGSNESKVQEVAGSNFTLTYGGLAPGTEYMCTITARTGAGYGTVAMLEVWTRPKAPTIPNLTNLKQNLKITDTTITFSQPQFTDPGVDKFEVHVNTEDKNAARRRRGAFNQDATSFSSCNKDSGAREAYIAAQLNKDQTKGTFTVGDNKVYNDYWNCPLVKGNVYSIYYAAVAENEAGDETRSFVHIGTFKALEPISDDTIMITAVCVSTVLVIMLVIGLTVYLLRRRRHKDHSSTHTKLGIQMAPVQLVTDKNAQNVDPIPHRVDINQPVGGRAVIDDDAVDTIANEDVYANAPISIKKNYKISLKVDSLLPYIKDGRADKNANFTAEYESLPEGLVKTIGHRVGSKPANRLKNRFVNIMAYDHSRVILDKLDDDPDSDYINACYIDGYKKTKQFIACQGATKVMVGDFWRMIWQYSLNRIVMVTNPVENGKRKCEQYWPEDNEDYHIYEGIRITVDKVEIFSDFTVRSFVLTKGEQMKSVWQFHYTAWPDHGVPTHATSLLSFRRKVKSYDTVSYGPTVVHCSAGVGRTGTYIALDFLLEQAKQEHQVQVYTFVEYMRNQRVSMIQTLDQYMFLYNAIFEGMRSGDTVITTQDFQQSYDALTKMAAGSSCSKLEEQFDTLLSMRMEISPDDQQAGKSAQNADKNRSMDIIPRNSARPYLSLPVENTTDYINAVYLDGYKQKDAYIVTQSPLPNTVCDMWRLLADHRSNTVVMLNRIDSEDETCPQYWPEAGATPMTHGPITVINKGTEHKSQSMTVQNFSLSHKTKGSSFEIKHVQLTDWPAGCPVPSSASGMLAVMDLIERWQRHTAGRPVTVHCLDGASRSGVFIAVNYIIEKLKLEQEIDIFNAVRHIQKNRPQFVSSKEQYKFCHDAVVEYLKSCDTYSNFM